VANIGRIEECGGMHQRKVRPPARVIEPKPDSSPAPLARRAAPARVPDQVLLALGQPKLRVGPAGDACEREADEVSKAIVDSLRHQSTAPVAARTVRRTIQRGATIGTEGGVLDAATDAAVEGAKRSGSLLATPVRRRMEDAFGADFSGVKIHTGPQAARVNDRIQASAFTLGKHIFFRDGTPDAASAAGQGLLAHELTHTIQQGGPSVRRLMSFDGKSLKGLTSTKGKILNSSLHQLVGTYRKYVDAAVGKAGATAEYGLLV
jgi:hypothetical protein